MKEDLVAVLLADIVETDHESYWVPERITAPLWHVPPARRPLWSVLVPMRQPERANVSTQLQRCCLLPSRRRSHKARVLARRVSKANTNLCRDRPPIGAG